MNVSATPRHVNVLIAGAGNAGLMAGTYAARMQMDTVILGSPWGSQLAQSADVENYPGFKRAPGADIVESQRQQAEDAGARFQDAQITSIEGSQSPFQVHLDGGETIVADSVILATGAHARKLGAPGEAELLGHGVSTCATCDGPLFKGKNLVIVGGGDTAMEEATYLSRLASHVTIVHRRGELKGEKIVQERLQKLVAEGKVTLAMNQEIEKINGTPETGLQSLDIVSHPEGGPVTHSQLPADGLFVAVGHQPNSEFLQGSAVERNQYGHVLTHEHVKTNVPGIFAAGDVTDVPYYQASVASGFGAIAGIEASHFVEQLR